MIEVRVGELASSPAGAVVRPVATDFSAVTPAMRRFDDVAGPAVIEQCARLGDLPLGSAAITAAGKLPAGFIVHVAVRSPTDNPTSAIVRNGLRNALRRLTEWDVESVALVPLGTGAGNLDAEESAAAMLPLLTEYERERGRPLAMSVLVEDPYQKAAFEAELARITGSWSPAGPGGEGASGDRVGPGS